MDVVDPLFCQKHISMGSFNGQYGQRKDKRKELCHILKSNISCFKDGFSILELYSAIHTLLVDDLDSVPVYDQFSSQLLWTGVYCVHSLAFSSVFSKLLLMLGYTAALLQCLSFVCTSKPVGFERFCDSALQQEEMRVGLSCYLDSLD